MPHWDEGKAEEYANTFSRNLMFNELSHIGLIHSSSLIARQVCIKSRLQGQYILYDFASDGTTRDHRDELLEDFIANAEDREKKEG